MKKYFAILVTSFFLLLVFGTINKVFASALCDGVFICGDPVKNHTCSLKPVSCSMSPDSCQLAGPSYGVCQEFSDCFNPTNPANYQCSNHFDWESTCGPADYCASIGKCELYNYCNWLGLTPTPIPTATPTNAPGVTPTSVPPTSTPIPTPTYVPGSPTCGGISGPSCTYTNTNSTYVPSCVAGSGSLTRVDLWFSPTSTQSWYNIYGGAAGNLPGTVGPSAPATINWPSAGTYYVTANAWNSDGKACSGNPFISSWPVSGFDYCGASDLKTVRVYDPVTISPPVLIGPTGTIACGSLPTSPVTLSWQPVAGATRYSVRANDTTANGWNGLCNGGEFPEDLCDDYVTGTSYVYNSIPGDHVQWQVQAIYDNPCTGVATWSTPTGTSFDMPVCPSCTISMGAINIPGVGSSVTQGVTYTESIGTISKIDFSLASAIAHITSTTPDTASPFTVTLMGDSIGSGATLNAIATMNDNTTTCSTTAPVSVSESPWFQVGGGNAIFNGSLSQTIPSTAIDTRFIRDPVGLLVYSSLLQLGSGKISSTDVSVSTTITETTPTSFDLFYNQKLPTDVKSGLTILTGNTLDMSTIPASCATVRGYHICYYNGGSTNDLTLNGNYVMPIGERDILFVDNADVTIAGSIKPTTRGKASFLLISKGDIYIDPSVGGSFGDSSPDIEAVLYTDGTFHSGHDSVSNYDTTLHIRGSVVAKNSTGNSLDLKRTLFPGGAETNGGYPAEYFEYGPEQVFAFPPFLMLRTISTNEVSP